MIRGLSRWAGFAMLGLPAAALVNLAMAFLPLADLHAVHHPGASAANLALVLRVLAWVLLLWCLAVAAISWTGWFIRARGNLAAFGIRSYRVVESVGLPLRRRLLVLSRAFYFAAFAAFVAWFGAWLAGRSTADEIGAVRAQARAGRAVDDALAAHLFGRELLLYLPAAVLFALAAGFALFLIGSVTSAQYGRVARLRVAVGGTIGA